MMNDSAELIERYFEDSLSPRELEAFRQRLETDPEFARAFQVEKDLMEGIEAIGNQNLRKELEGMYKEEIAEQEKPAPKLISRRWLFVAAAALAAFVVARLLMQPMTPEKLYARYFQPEFAFTEKGGVDQQVAQAENMLKNARYAEALPLLDVLLETNPQSTKFQFAKGICLMETGNYDNAIKLFQSLKNKPLLRDEAAWYEALVYLKQNDLVKCKSALAEIDPVFWRYDDVLNLLSEID